MIKEILTLELDSVPVQYYIKFGKDRKRFSFEPTLKNKAAPVFVILVANGQLVEEDAIEPGLASQAREKIKEILSDTVFDQF